MIPIRLSTGGYGLYVILTFTIVVLRSLSFVSAPNTKWLLAVICYLRLTSRQAVFSFGIMGAARGIDEGLISGTFNQANFQELLGFDKLDEVALANIKGNVSSMVQIGSVGGAALAFLLADRIGRLWATRQLCIVWILGIVIFLTNGGRLGQVYASRLIAGLGIGQTVVIAPVYISEVAPKSVRGLCTCVFSGSVYLGIMLAYFVSVHLRCVSIFKLTLLRRLHGARAFTSTQPRQQAGFCQTPSTLCLPVLF